MAKFTKIYHDGEIDLILEFRGRKFIAIWGKWDNGRRTMRTESFELQIEQVFKDDEDLEEILECVNILDNEEDDVEEALNDLEGWE